jgi:hypothetical protein
MKSIGRILTVAITTMAALHAQTPPAAPRPESTPQPQSAAPESPAPGSGLSDLDAMTFGCPKAALNAAAREAAQVKSQGTYQFAYFRIVSDSHHAAYEVHFKSNYEGEPELKYCVALYCQQGWDPKTAKTSVTLMTKERPRGGAARHDAACDGKSTPAKPRAKP